MVSQYRRPLDRESERRHAVGDKGKKDKNKGLKQKQQKREQKAKRKLQKQPKRTS